MNKTVTLLVGAQGSGKSTYCKNLKNTVPDLVIISQDDMGKDGHLVEYEQALKAGAEYIVIDRINHTREQRNRYLDLAKFYDYETEILVQNMPFEECFDRIVNRADHATIPMGDNITAVRALRTYFSQYQRPTPNEADKVFYRSAYDPFLLDLNNTIPIDTRHIIIGDVHGCYDELMELLEKVQYEKGKDVLIFVGDLIDRGPKIKEVLEFAINTPNVYSVMGNHEWKMARFLADMYCDNKTKIKISHGLQSTIDQCGQFLYEKALKWVWSLPVSIKIGNSYIFHAGVNPRYPMVNQRRDFLLYARKYNPATNSYSDENSPYWHEYEFNESFKGKRLFFGHEVHYDTLLKEADPMVVSMDGGCVFGDVMRAAVSYGEDVVMAEVQSKQSKTEHEPLHENWAEPYEALVKEGYLNRSDTPDLVLYNYSDSCAYDKKWNKYTSESRGIIFEKNTGKLIAKPFPKFFNVGEMEESRLENLPKEPYECFEKMDGSLGIVFHYKNEWRVATRGSFSSVQSQKATELLDNYAMDFFPTKYTLLVEIIYPENRTSPGARLVTDYGQERFLCLLAAYNRETGEEVSRAGLEKLANNSEMPITTKYTHTIEQMIALQKTLPAEKEGFVVRFKNGFRVKIKGEEYLKMHRILNSITPLFIYELMCDNSVFNVPGEYLLKVPEEYRDEVLEIVHKLQNRYSQVRDEVEFDVNLIGTHLNRDLTKGVELDDKRAVGIWLKDSGNLKLLRHSPAIFARILNNNNALDSYVKKVIRPTANIL